MTYMKLLEQPLEYDPSRIVNIVIIPEIWKLGILNAGGMY